MKKIQTVSILLFLVAFLLSSVSFSDETGKYNFKLKQEYKLKGSIEYKLKFDLHKPNIKDWKPFIKGMLNYRNTTNKPVYAYIAVALFDKNGNLLSASCHPTFTETVTKPGSSMSINIDFGICGYKVEDISYFLINFKESSEPLLSKE